MPFSDNRETFIAGEVHVGKVAITMTSTGAVRKERHAAFRCLVEWAVTPRLTPLMAAFDWLRFHFNCTILSASCLSLVASATMTMA